VAVPLAQTWAVTRHVLWHKLRRTPRYAVVLMLEPLLRCNLACPGCGKIQQPPDVLRRQLTPAQCFNAAQQCGAPIVSIAGGEPLLHPQIAEIVEGLVARKKFVYLCTNAVKLEASLDQFQPDQRLTLSVHLDGPQAVHDEAVGQTGVFDRAIRAIRAALASGFRVTTNMTLFHGADVDRLRRHFDQIIELGVEGMMISPGYAYAQAPHQAGFLSRESTRELFRRLLKQRNPKWRFHQTPLFLEFLQGRYDLQCTPWGNPTYNVFGWQRPCYLLNEGHAESFTQLLETTDWTRYGQAGGHPACRDCMVHCGYEPSALDATLGTPGGLLATVRSLLGGALTEQLPSKNATTVPARWGAD
jgi:hopanoid biosynthesis associated radical SAM protein HpnH